MKHTEQSLESLITSLKQLKEDNKKGQYAHKLLEQFYEDLSQLPTPNEHSVQRVVQLYHGKMYQFMHNEVKE